MDGRKNNKGTKGNKGNSGKGYGPALALKANVDKFSPIFWDQLEMMITHDDLNLRKFAMTEFNKIQCKMIPQDVTSGGDKIEVIPILNNVFSNNQPKKDIGA